jgi:hypothetical protein
MPKQFDNHYNDKAYLELELFVDSLLISNHLNDSIDCRKYINKNKFAFIEHLIDNIDNDTKKEMIMPVQINEMTSNIPTKKYYIGCRAVCLINQLVNNTSEDVSKLVRDYCITGLLSNKNSEITLSDLKKFKILASKWLINASKLSVKQQQNSWNEIYSSHFKN